MDRRLIRNGGDTHIGSPSRCFRKGVGGGLHQQVDNEAEFVKQWIGSPYDKYIKQPMFYGDGEVPEGKIRATLGQCLSRGFAVGSIQLAKKIEKRRTGIHN